MKLFTFYRREQFMVQNYYSPEAIWVKKGMLTGVSPKILRDGDKRLPIWGAKTPGAGYPKLH